MLKYGARHSLALFIVWNYWLGVWMIVRVIRVIEKWNMLYHHHHHSYWKRLLWNDTESELWVNEYF